MKISFYTVKDNLDTTRGYGNAGFNVVRSLQSLGHDVPFDDPTAPVQIAFCPPHWYKFHEGQYKIGYTPWESTELPDGWVERMNECDEVWATSEWVAEVYKNAGVTKPIHVYHHGLDHKWEPKKRERKDVVKFLHVGEPALRKGGQMTVDAFRAVFGNREDVHLTIKAYHQHYLRVWKDGEITTPEKAYNNVTIINDSIPEKELMDLYYDNDVMVYPSYGEGFGLIPLQALGTGMPVICTDEWAPYRNYTQMLSFGGRWDRSIWALHPGNVFYPDYDWLKSKMEHLVDDEPNLLERMFQKYYDQAEYIHKEYDWNFQTEHAFRHIIEKFTES